MLARLTDVMFSSAAEAVSDIRPNIIVARCQLLDSNPGKPN